MTAKVAIVGAGLIGRAWVIVFARAGWDVAVTDPEPSVTAQLSDQLQADCEPLQKHGLLADPAMALARVEIRPTLAEAVAAADFVQENGPETVEAKTAIFSELDRLAPPDAVIASSTSAIVASRFTESLAGRHRCLVGHPVNPPHLVPLVELCGAPWTNQACLDRAHAVYTEIGQSPITVRRETDGFVLNRLQGALLAEAFRLVRDGVVSPEDLDVTVEDGLGLRWAFMGPFATIELNAPGGMADYCDRYTGFYRRLLADPPVGAFDAPAVGAVTEAWPHQPDAPRLQRATARRNDRLAALRAHKATQNSGTADND